MQPERVAFDVLESTPELIARIFVHLDTDEDLARACAVKRSWLASAGADGLWAGAVRAELPAGKRAEAASWLFAIVPAAGGPAPSVTICRPHCGAAAGCPAAEPPGLLARDRDSRSARSATPVAVRHRCRTATGVTANIPVTHTCSVPVPRL
jgi:hypothetical protein